MKKTTPKSPRNIQILSLFSGAGGLDLAFERVGGFSTQLALESQPEFAATVTANKRRGWFAETTVLCADIRTVDPRSILSRYFQSDSTKGVIAGPPCESFSSMGRRNGTRDHRGALVYETLRWIQLINPDFFLIENVPDLATAGDGKPFARLLAELALAGFGVSHSVLRAADYGAATMRRRLFVVGFRGSRVFSFPAPTHASPSAHPNFLRSGLRAWVTTSDVLRVSSPSLRNNVSDPLDVRVRHTPAVVARFRSVKPGSYDNIRKRSRLRWGDPAPSLVAGNLQGTRTHIHPDEPRELTNRECARIQGFPDDFEFCGSAPAISKQLANAVPIELGAALARAIRSQLKGLS